MQNIGEVVTKLQIEKRTVDSFKECFRMYQCEEKSEFESIFNEYKEVLLEFIIKSIDFRIIDFEELIFDNIISTVDIYYNSKYKGYYKLIFSIDGDIVDDMLVIE